MKSVVHNIMNQKPEAILIDSSNLLHRTVWIAENVRTNVNPSYIFLTSIKKYATMFNCTNIYSVWDKRLIRGIKNYRRLAKSVEYKGTRDVVKNNKVFSHEDLTTELLNCMGIKNMYPGILEADDVIAWLSKKISGRVVIVSVDQDMLQLIDDKTTVYSPIKDVLIDNSNFSDITGVSIDNFLRYKSLMGDKSDNLPGVSKCGPKTAQKLIETCPTDDLLLEKLGEKKLQPYYTNKKLIDLSQGIIEHPDDERIYQEQYKSLESYKPDFNKFKKMCEDLNMNAITNKMHEWENLFNQTNISNTLENIVNKLQLNK